MMTIYLSFLSAASKRSRSRQQCFMFDISTLTKQRSQVDQIEVWLKTKTSSYTNASYSLSLSSVTHQLADRVVALDGSWQKYDVTRFVCHIIDSVAAYDDAVSFCATCDSCPRRQHVINTSRRHRPLLVASMTNAPSHSRARRAVTEFCQPGGRECCLHPLTFSMADLGYRSVVSPHVVHMNRCRGACTRSPYYGKYNNYRIPYL